MSEEELIPDTEAPVDSTLEEAPLLENWVIFNIGGEGFNPDVITRELGIDPDRVFYPGQNNGRSLWQIRSTLGASETLEAHFWQILTRLLPVRKSLLKIARDAELNFHCSMRRGKGSRTDVCLSPRLLILVGYMGAFIEFELRE